MAIRARPADCCTPKAVRPLSEASAQKLTRVASALADASRIEILRLLSRQAGPVCACDIVGHFDLSQPTISHHLKILRDAGLVRATRKGLWAFYEVDARGSRALEALRELTR